ncbi:MAG TPA: glycosyltransferase family 1 protein [Urbifossiella sp.]|jgi:glycosyltransferase involved in cell wall biosynthesis|nr:glycosyltransferase family 1 protein [Urbifossiella sp.]
MARILIATDAWHPQVNGVVRTLDTTARRLRDWGHAVEVVEPGAFAAVGVPFYPEIRLALPRPGRVYDRVRRFRPDYVHISTEGPIGLLVRHFCRRRRWGFTTSYHTRFPEYLNELAGVPLGPTYRFLRWFHGGAGAVLVATPSLEKELTARGFRPPLRRWSRGVDLTLFHPRPRPAAAHPRPVLLYVGRVSHEKNVEDFLRLGVPGTKLVVGDGPARAELERKYPAAVFLGYRRGAALGEAYAAADVFVFPSRTDTFGMVVIEAFASGLPVAAYPAMGPIDTVTNDKLGALDDDLGRAVRRALETGDPAACAAEGAGYTWDHCTHQFLTSLVPVSAGPVRRG